MSEFQNKPNTGAIFKNDKKSNEKQPDYQGKINVDGKDKQIALWVKDGAKGKYFSVQISEPYVKPVTGATLPPNTSFDNPSDDLPF